MPTGSSRATDGQGALGDQAGRGGCSHRSFHRRFASSHAHQRVSHRDRRSPCRGHTQIASRPHHRPARDRIRCAHRPHLQDTTWAAGCVVHVTARWPASHVTLPTTSPGTGAHATDDEIAGSCDTTRSRSSTLGRVYRDLLWSQHRCRAEEARAREGERRVGRSRAPLHRRPGTSGSPDR
jgi:hypothetical protein